MAGFDMMKMRGGPSAGGDEDEEAPDSERAEEEEAEDGPALMEAMWAACKAGDFEEAWAKLEAAVTLAGED